MSATIARSDRRAAITAAAMLLGIAVLLLLVPEALAQAGAGGGEDVGKNFGDLLQGYATQIYLGIVAIVSIVFLINRAYAQLGVFMIAAVAVGMLVVAPSSFQNFAGDTAQALFGR
ncbi:MAG: hypothetical protein LC777_14290 [Actinobacteria bacterium]|nr:hypothetical protein [Actinomycetota bacterium]